MDVDGILSALRYGQGLPLEALRAAAANREGVLPAFMVEIDRALSGPVDGAAAERLFFIFHLLGDWRERSAYRHLARLLRLPGEVIDRVLNDATTVTSHRVMAAVFDGDPQPLYEIILDQTTDEYIRSRMCEALAMVTVRGALAREEARRFLRGCFDELQPVTDCFVWNGWQSAIAMLGAAELKPLVKMAFARGSIDSTWLSYGDFVRDLEFAIGHDGALPIGPRDEYELFGDTVAELSTWYGFSPQYERERRGRERDAAKRQVWNETVLNPYPKVGRNEPCPCGSGKKFKKCCGQPAAMTA